MQTHEAITKRLNVVFREVFDDDDILISDAMTADDLEEWDSVSHITLVMAVEREFGVKLTASEVGGLSNVGDMVRLLQDRATV
jgi:acyl carrier protein